MSEISRNTVLMMSGGIPRKGLQYIGFVTSFIKTVLGEYYFSWVYLHTSMKLGTIFKCTLFNKYIITVYIPQDINRLTCSYWHIYTSTINNMYQYENGVRMKVFIKTIPRKHPQY